MRWLCLAVCVVVAQTQRFFDVKGIVQETLEAMSKLPTTMEKNLTAAETNSTASDPNILNLLKLPADIVHRLAETAGYVDSSKEQPPTMAKPEATQIPDSTKFDKEESFESGFKTFEQMQAEEKRALEGLENLKTRSQQPKSDEMFDIRKLIEATSRSLQAAAEQRSLPTLGTSTPNAIASGEGSLASAAKEEILYKPIKQADGQILFEQVRLVTSNGQVRRITAQNLLPMLPMGNGAVTSSSSFHFPAPTFPPMVNLFDLAPETTTPSTSTTQPNPEKISSKKSELARKKIASSLSPTAKQFASKTVEMSSPLALADAPVDVVEQRPTSADVSRHRKPKSLHGIRTIDSSVKKHVINESRSTTGEEVEVVEQPKEAPRRRIKIQKNRKDTTTTAAPSVEPASETFAQQFADALSEHSETKTTHRKVVRRQRQMKNNVSAEQVGEVPQKIRRITITPQARPEAVEQKPKTKGSNVDKSVEKDAGPVIRIEKKRRRNVKKATKQQCLNIRSFARQFVVDDVDVFAREHCGFIENYYPNLKCSNVDVYMAACKKHYADI